MPGRGSWIYANREGTHAKYRLRRCGLTACDGPHPGPPMTVRVDVEFIAEVVLGRIDVPKPRGRTPDSAPPPELADSVRRNGLLEPIGVQAPGIRKRNVCYRLIWDRRRLEAYREHPELLGTRILASVLPASTTDAELEMLKAIETRALR